MALLYLVTSAHVTYFEAYPHFSGEHTPLREDYVYLNPDVMTAGGFVINQTVSVSLKPAEQSVGPLVGGESAGQPGRSHLVLKAWPVQKLSIES